MTLDFDIEGLLNKPVAMMTGEELCYLIFYVKNSEGKPEYARENKQKYYGIDGIAQLFGCSGPTACRIKKSGIIDDAITQVGRKIIVDGEKALALAKAAAKRNRHLC